MKKTPAARELDQAGISYEIHEFEAKDFTAEEVARELNVPLPQVFKTLVAEGDSTGIVMACIPADRELDFKALAKASGNKKAAMVRKSEVEKLTGYLTGGCSPLAGKKRHPLYLDESGLGLPFISVSAGLRGLQLFLTAEDLARVTGASFARLTRGDTE